MNHRVLAGNFSISSNHLIKNVSAWILIFFIGSVLGLFIGVDTGFSWESVESENVFERRFLDNGAEIKGQSFLIYIINFDDFMCMSCLNSFLEFYYVLPPPFQNERAVGILVGCSQEQEKSGSRSQKIIKKKLNGFIQANQIGFPIFIDSSESFTYLSNNNTAVVVLSEGLDRSRTYIFPLSSQDQEEILKTLF